MLLAAFFCLLLCCCAPEDVADFESLELRHGWLRANIFMAWATHFVTKALVVPKDDMKKYGTLSGDVAQCTWKLHLADGKAMCIAFSFLDKQVDRLKTKNKHIYI